LVEFKDVKQYYSQGEKESLKIDFGSKGEIKKVLSKVGQYRIPHIFPRKCQK